MTAGLPTISEVDRADAACGVFTSALDSLADQVAAFLGDEASLEDAVFLDRAGIAVEEKRRYADPATIARLLVFADETLDALDWIRADAEQLRRDLLSAYREYVLEPSGRRRMREPVAG